MSSDSEDYERLLNERIAERESRKKGLKKEYNKMNSNFKQPVYTPSSPDITPAHHESVFSQDLSLDLDPDKVTESSSNNVPVSPFRPKSVPTLAELASRKKRLHKGGRKSKKNRRRGSRRRSRSSRR